MIIDRDQWSEIIQLLRRNRVRTLLTASGIFWGTFVLIVMLGFGNGIQDGVVKRMSDYATNSLYVWGNRTSEAYQGLSPGRRIVLNNSDTAALTAQVTEIAHLAPRARLARYRGRNDITHAAKVTDAEVTGDLPAYQYILPMAIEEGRFLNPFDITEKRKVAVIGERIRNDLFGRDGNPLGRDIQIRGVSFTVIGVFKPQRYGNSRERMESMVFLPLSTFQQVFNRGQDISFYAAVPVAGTSSEALRDKMFSVLKARHRIAPDDDRALGDWNSELEFLRITNLFAGIRAFIWTVGIATLLAGVLGVSNIMLIAIRERRREFGIRKSVGATPSSVIRMVLFETATLVGVAGTVGLLFGLMALAIIDFFTQHLTQNADVDVLFGAPRIDLHVVVAAFVALLLAALLATLLPASHAMKIDPIDALRAE